MTDSHIPAIYYAPEDPSAWRIWSTPLSISAIILFITMATIFYMLYRTLKQSERNRQREMELQDIEMQPLNIPERSGVDPLVRERMTEIVYRADSVLPYNEERCALCCYEFKDGESLTFLPPCNHVFHSPCISPYLLSNTICPSCRQFISFPNEM